MFPTVLSEYCLDMCLVMLPAVPLHTVIIMGRDLGQCCVCACTFSDPCRALCFIAAHICYSV